MAEASITEIFNVPAKTIFKVVADFSRYPEFISDVKRVSIIDNQGEKKLVEYEINIIKSFRYQAWTVEKPYSEVSWKFHAGDLFKDNFGKWTFKELDANRTQVDYSISAKFNLFVPGMIEKKLIEVNLPSMMKSFKQRAESLKG